MKIENIRPQDIEKRSFEIIGETLGERDWDELHKSIIYRAIHTSADFDYADNLWFSENGAERILDALRNGAHVVTDTNMAYSGINKKKLAAFGGEAHCFMADEDVAKEAQERGVTRAIVSMEKAAKLGVPTIFAIGNAPTALIRIKELMDAGELSPAGIIGAPVGFVNVIESKERIMKADAPMIVARGRKGGSNIAAAIINALLYSKC